MFKIIQTLFSQTMPQTSKYIRAYILIQQSWGAKYVATLVNYFMVLENDQIKWFYKKTKTSKKQNNLATGVSSTGENFHLSLVYLYPKAQTFVLFQSLLLP